MTQKEYYDFREDENTRQVSLINLLKCALKSWKIILISGIIVGCLFGAYKIFSIRSQKDTMIEEYDNYVSKRDAYKESINEYKQTVSNLQKKINSKLAYIENSTKMSLDPYNSPMATAELNVTSPKKITSDQLVALKTAIYNEILFGESVNTVAKNHDISSTSLRELITVKQAATGGTIRITVRALDEETAAAYRDDLLAEIEKMHVSLEKELGEFDISVFNKGVMTGYDSELFTFQDKQNTSVTTLESSAYTAQNQSNQLTKPVAVPQYSKKYMLINGIKMGLVGLIGGIALAIIGVITMLIRNGAIFTSDEVDGEFGIRTLADLSATKPEKADAELDYIMARIENYVKKDGSARIALVGQADDKNIRFLLDALSKKAGSSMKFVHLPDILKNAASLRELLKTDGAVLVEEIGKSDYTNIRREIAIIADSGKEIVGSVYF